jgi:hypothetical protein
MRTPQYLLLIPLSAFLLTNATGQQPATGSQDPNRNFVGKWSGVILVNSSNDPPQVQLTISEKKNGGEMVWDYTFGQKGQAGYERSSKVVVLKPHDEVMLMQWKGYAKGKFTTSGLEAFARAGYGKFTASPSWEKSTTATQGTFELQANEMTYLWEETTNDKTKVSSEFSFHRVSDASASTQNSISK